MRLIDADKLEYRVMTECNPYGKPTLEFESGIKVMGMIEDAPTIEAIPVVHGQFVKNETGVNRHCTACGAYLEDREYENHTVRFCYYCGAKMGGERKDGAI